MNPEAQTNNMRNMPMRNLFAQIKSRILNIQSSENIELSRNSMQASMEEFFLLLEDVAAKRKQNYERYCVEVEKIFSSLANKGNQSVSNVNELEDQISKKWPKLEEMMSDMDRFDQIKKKLFRKNP